MAYNKYLRQKLLSEALNKLTDEERRELHAENRHQELLGALKMQQEDLKNIADRVGRQSWLTGFASDIAANFTTDGLIWLGSRLLRRL